jgi:hypothetical protein
VGIFFETRVHQDVEDAVRRVAEHERRGEDDVEGELARLTLLHGAPRTQELQWNRLLIAIGLVGILAAGGVAAEWGDLTTSSDALWGLATATFGIAAGLIGGEEPSARDSGGGLERSEGISVPAVRGVRVLAAPLRV